VYECMYLYLDTLNCARYNSDPQNESSCAKIEHVLCNNIWELQTYNCVLGEQDSILLRQTRTIEGILGF
jgi:hypothetical protein